MKKLFLNLMAAGAAGLLASASAQTAADNNAADNDNGNTNDAQSATADQMPAQSADAAPDAGTPPATDATTADMSGDAAAPGEKTVKDSEVILPQTAATADQGITPDFNAPALANGTNNNPNDISLNFRNAPLEMVLDYLSDASDFIIVLDTRVNGTVSIKGNHLTRDEAVDQLNAVLNKNGYAAIRNGRTLTILDKNDAKTRNIPVKSGNIPDAIPNNAEIVTQIIPIRFVEARQLVSDLTSFVSPEATVVANEEGNSIVITDTQANIRHLTEIIKAVDDSAEAETEIRVFHLKYASPTDVASELASIFPSATGNITQSPIRFGGGGGGGGPGGFFARMMGGGGGGGGTAGSSSNDRVKKATQVNAVADARIQAVIVTAPKDLMEQIASMMNDLDVPSTRDQKVYVFHMNNGDPQQAVQVLQSMFQSSSTSRSGSSSSSQNSALMTREQNNTTATSTTSSSSGSSFGGTSSGRVGGSQF